MSSLLRNSPRQNQPKTKEAENQRAENGRFAVAAQRRAAEKKEAEIRAMMAERKPLREGFTFNESRLLLGPEFDRLSKPDQERVIHNFIESEEEEEFPYKDSLPSLNATIDLEHGPKYDKMSQTEQEKYDEERKGSVLRLRAFWEKAAANYKKYKGGFPEEIIQRRAAAVKAWDNMNKAREDESIRDKHIPIKIIAEIDKIRAMMETLGPYEPHHAFVQNAGIAQDVDITQKMMPISQMIHRSLHLGMIEPSQKQDFLDELTLLRKTYIEKQAEYRRMKKGKNNLEAAKRAKNRNSRRKRNNQNHRNGKASRTNNKSRNKSN